MEQIIINGGVPLHGCPENWDEAKKWEEKSNEDKVYGEPHWSFDCGFKLDFDGPLVRIDSRFYPPKTHYGSTWDGTVTLIVGEKEILEKKFDCASLSELKDAVEDYTKRLHGKLLAILTDPKNVSHLD